MTKDDRTKDRFSFQAVQLNIIIDEYGSVKEYILGFYMSRKRT